MKKQRILLTGDDGYNSLGTRVLIHLLKEDFDLSIAGTLTQQSGVGGHKHIVEGGVWGEDIVDDVPALWLDGSPVDVMEAAKIHFSQPFDYCISGINWGINIDGCLYSSGTFSAAYYAHSLGVANKIIAISWDIPSAHYFIRHNGIDLLDEFIKHPGESAKMVIHTSFEKNLWGAEILNINIPSLPTNIIEFATPLSFVYGFWPDIVLDKETAKFYYGKGNHSLSFGASSSESQVLERNHISILPCQGTMFNNVIYEKIKKTETA